MQQKHVFIVVIALLLILINPNNTKAININVSSSCDENITISNEVLDQDPVFYGESPILIVKVNGTNISKVWLESNFKGSFNNYFNISNILNLYSFTIPIYDLNINQVVSWRYKANNTCGAVTTGTLQNFLVLGTSLITNPLNPDGNNGWFKTIPTISLNYNNVGDTFYGFSNPIVPYIGEFLGTEDNLTGGISTIGYYTIDDSGRVEPLREFISKVDFTIPSIIDEMPQENSISNNMPLIKATLKEIYQGSSGLDDASVLLMLDGNVLSHEYVSYNENHADVRYQVNVTLINGTHNVSLYIEDNAGNSNLKEWNFNVNNDLFNIELLSPVDEGIYNKKRVNFDINIDVVIEKLELGINGKFSKLCNNCNAFNKSRTLKEGLNNITIRGTNFGNVNEINLQVFVDTINPKIKKTEPKGNQVTNGTFKVFYSENNLKEIELFWRKNEDANFSEVNLDNCEAGDNKECLITVDLSSVEDEEIDYYFKISDDINDVVSRTIESVDVDTISPEINIFNPLNTQYGNNVLFDINISEEASLSYIDFSSRNPVQRNLCRNCDSFNRMMTFSEGDHDIAFLAKDKAGNSDINYVSFNVLD
ncbi:hypothetical protein J4455_00335 [Candidatus Woesearchaeota archaeon]|nr:hypothetical protein [Candidatus Woesearchaeota archaeon]